LSPNLAPVSTVSASSAPLVSFSNFSFPTTFLTPTALSAMVFKTSSVSALNDFEYCLEIAKEEANYILEERKKAEKVSPNFFGISWDVMKTI